MSTPTLHFSTLHPIESLSEVLSQGIVKVYQKAFAEPPWNEVYKDKQGQFYGHEYFNQVESLQLKPAYPTQETAFYIRSELQHSNSILVVAELNSNLVGFCWGYTFTLEGFLGSKYSNLTNIEADTAYTLLSQKLETDTFFYFSEFAVDPSLQGQGIGKQLVTLLYAHKPDNQAFVVRTHFQSPMVKIVSGLSSQTQPNILFGPYTTNDPDNSSRVLMSL